MPVNEREFVISTLEASVKEFFAAYGVPCSAGYEDPAGVTPGAQMGSIVGFRGDQVRGGLAFVAPADLIAQILPVPPEEARADLQLRDWSAEIANQLAGRLKNKVSLRGIDFEVGTPVCFRGSSIQLSFLPDADGLSLAFEASGSPVRVYLDCAMRTNRGVDEDALRIVPEGEVLLF